MTPPAATAAGRALRPTAVPRGPRRVSGPARPRTAAPRRRAADPFVVRALRRGRSLADSRFLDRLVRGRLWIPLVAASLMGIVFMQVSMLKLNAGISRAVQTASTLERQNAILRADVSRMEAGERIDRVAHGLGMVVPADGGAHYVVAGGRGAAALAARRMTAADPTALARAQAGLRAAATQAASLTPSSPPASASASAASATATTATTAGAPTAPPSSTATAAPPTSTTGTAPAATTAAPAPVQAQTAPPVATSPAGGTAAPVSGQG